MKSEEIANIEEVDEHLKKTMKAISGTIMGIMKSTSIYFKEFEGEDGTGLFACPDCGFHFIPEEAGIEMKTFDGWWNLQEKENTYIYNMDKIINEHIYGQIVDLIGTIVPKTEEVAPQEKSVDADIQHTIESLKPTMKALAQVHNIMGAYKDYMANQPEVPNTIEFETLKSIDSTVMKAMKKLQEIASNPS